jgi:hypothetical protein
MLLLIASITCPSLPQPVDAHESLTAAAAAAAAAADDDDDDDDDAVLSL